MYEWIDLEMITPQQAKKLDERFKTQIQIHKLLSDKPNIVKLIQSFQDDRYYHVVMEYCDTDLSRQLKKRGSYSINKALKYFRQILQGYKAIYDLHATHRDLKPQNILIKNDTMYLSDFGFVKIFSNDGDIEIRCLTKKKCRTQSFVGSYKYMAPDVLKIGLKGEGMRAYNAQKCDIWSMGIILYKLIYGKQPYSSNTQISLMQEIRQKQIQFPQYIMNGDKKQSKLLPGQLKNIILKMLKKQQQQRYSFKKLYKDVKLLMGQTILQQQLSNQFDSTEFIQNQPEQFSRQKHLNYYFQLTKKIYNDSINYATLRQIGIGNYHKVTCKLMTFIHQICHLMIDNKNNQEQITQITQQLKKQINQYHSNFHVKVKQMAQITSQTNFVKLLVQIYQKIQMYSQFDLLIKQVQIFLIDLLVLLCFEVGIVKTDYMATWIMKCEMCNQKALLSFKQKTLILLKRQLKKININSQIYKKPLKNEQTVQLMTYSVVKDNKIMLTNEQQILNANQISIKQQISRQNKLLKQKSRSRPYKSNHKKIKT